MRLKVLLVIVIGVIVILGSIVYFIIYPFLFKKKDTVYPIYVTIVMHNEERFNYDTNRTYYLQSRTQLLKFAQLLHQYGAAFDWQSDWRFLKAVQLYDKGNVVSNTNGKNIVAYLYSLGVSIDPHAHESIYNYADVAELIRQLGVPPSKVVGGFLYYPPDNPQGWEKFKNPLKGRMFPNAVWQVEILWGASTAGHKGLDLHASGIWRPKSKDKFIIHDPNQPLIYVGGYRRTIGGVEELIRLAEEGKLESGKIYTATIFVAQAMLTDQFINDFKIRVLDKLKTYEEQGKIKWATLTQIVEIWKTQYDQKPNIFIALDEKDQVYKLFGLSP